jgi:ribulose-phosphate 3-epimerase
MNWDEWVPGIEVEPSIYAGDFSRLGEQLHALLDADARIFHFDVGDGHFIPEITIGPIVIHSIADLVHERAGVFDCHLMVSEPQRHLQQIHAAGGDSVTFHVEADGEAAETIAQARELGLGVGVAFNPETPVEEAADAAEGADLVLCMSIHPGLSGQELMPEALDRLRELRRLLPTETSIQVDGGIHLQTIAAVREAGANLLVSGSGVFWGDDPGAGYRDLVTAAGARSTETTTKGARR